MRVNETARAFFWVVLAGLLVWGGTLTFGFVWDDLPTVVSNRSLLNWKTAIDAFKADYWGLHEVPARSGYWRPVPTLIYLVTAKIFGVSAVAFHAVNVAFHLAVSGLVTLFLAQFGLTGLPLLLAALWFSIHPLHAEAVSFVSALPDLCAASFGLGALLCWAKKGHSNAAIGGGLLLLGCAFLSKESALVFVVPALYATWFSVEGSRERKRALVISAVMVALIFAYGATHVAVTSGVGARTLWGGSIESHLATVIRLLPYTLTQALVPFGMTPTRPFDVSSTFLEGRVWGSLAIWLVLLAATAWSWFRARKFAWAILLFFIFWLPVSNLIPAEGLVADRYLYLPLVGVALFIGRGAEIFSAFKTSSLALKGMLGLFAFSWGAYAFVTSRSWKSQEALWSHAAKKGEGSSVAWNEYGRLLLENGQNEEAKNAFSRALALAPEHAESKRNLILLRLRSGEALEALELTKQFVSENPKGAEGWDLQAAAAAAAGQEDISLASSRKAVELAPGNWKYHFNLGTALLLAGDEAGAVASLKKALGYGGDRPEVYMNLGAAHVGVGSWAEARDAYRKVLALRPDDARAIENLQIVMRRMELETEMMVERLEKR